MRKIFPIVMAASVFVMGAFMLLRPLGPSPRFQVPDKEAPSVSRRLKLEFPVPSGIHKYLSGEFEVSLDFGPRDIGSIFLGAPKARGEFTDGVISVEYPISPDAEAVLKGRTLWIRPSILRPGGILFSSVSSVSWGMVKRGRARGPGFVYMETGSGCDPVGGKVTLDLRVSDAAKVRIKPADEFVVHLMEMKCVADGSGGRPCDANFLDRVIITGKEFLDADYRLKVSLKGSGAPGSPSGRLWVPRLCGPGFNAGVVECSAPSEYSSSKVYPEQVYYFMWESGRVPRLCDATPIVTTLDVFDNAGVR